MPQWQDASKFTPVAPPPTDGAWQDASKFTPADEPPTSPSWFSRVFGPAYRGVKDIPKGIGDLAAAVTNPQKGMELVSGLWKNAKEHVAEGALMMADPKSHVLWGAERMAGGLPLIGPLMDKTADRDVLGQIGEGLNLGVQMEGPGLVGRAAGAAKIGGMFKNANAVDRAAEGFRVAHDMPPNAAVATGNPVVRGAQWLADRTIGGAIPGQRAAAAETSALQRVGAELADQINQNPANSLGVRQPSAQVTPHAAGAAATGAVGRLVKDFDTGADVGYDTFRQIEAANVQKVQTGTRTVQSKMLDAQGRPMPTTVEPVFEDIAFPVDLAPVKAALEPIVADMEKTMPVTQRAASPGLLAMKNLLDGPDFVAASTAEKNLSAMKKITRGADSPVTRNASQGLAAKTVSQLQTAVDDAVLAGGGQDALDALQAGRTATRAKYATADVLKSLKDEPVKLFRELTAPGDANVEHLKVVLRLAPDAGPMIGRAWMEDLLDDATSMGGFDKAKAVFNRYTKLGAQTKALLIPDAGLRAATDNFFHLAARYAENPNPSGSALTGALAAQAGTAVAAPMSLGATVAGGYGLSKLLHSEAGVKLLTEGLRIPAAGARATAWAASVASMAGKADEDTSRRPFALPTTTPATEPPPSAMPPVMGRIGRPAFALPGRRRFDAGRPPA